MFTVGVCGAMLSEAGAVRLNNGRLTECQKSWHIAR